MKFVSDKALDALPVEKLTEEELIEVAQQMVSSNNKSIAYYIVCGNYRALKDRFNHATQTHQRRKAIENWVKETGAIWNGQMGKWFVPTEEKDQTTQCD